MKAVDNAGNRAERKITVRIHTHRAVLVQAVEPTCLTKGNKAYYVCDCGRWYANSSCTTEITLQDVELPAKGHTEAIDPVKEATCMQTGLTQGSHCSDCGLVIKAQTVTPRWDIIIVGIMHTMQADTGEYVADVLHWKKSTAMYMTMIRMPSAMTVALTDDKEFGTGEAGRRWNRNFKSTDTFRTAG